MSATPDTLPRRKVYRREELKRLFEPRSVAVVGASQRAGAFGERTLALLADFKGAVYPINAKYDELLGRRCYPSLSALPEVPDCVVLAVGRENVEEYVLECARLGVGGVLIYASGYAETGKPDRIAQQARLSQIARDSNLRILGPNCMGLVNYAHTTTLSFVTYTPQPSPRAASVGIASQSGGMSNSLGQSIEHGASFSHTLSTGNSCDVDVADLVSYLADVPSCKAIACLFEGMADPLRMVEAAERAWAADKPLIVHKLATGKAGSAAAASHTGMLAGSNEAFRAAFERCGVIEAERFEDLVEMSSFFAKAPRPKAGARGAAVISTSGGVAIMSADAAEAVGVALPQPEPATREILEKHIPEFGSARNPCDVTAQVMGDLDALASCASALMQDPNYSVVVMGQPQAYAAAVPRIRMLSDLAKQHDVMACNVLVAQWADGPGAPESERDDRVALFRSMHRCFATLKAWHAREDRRLRGPRVAPRIAAASAAGTGAALISQTRGAVLTESESKRVLSAYGVSTVTEVLVQSVDEALKVAAGVDGAVVLKVESPDLPHKTEAGVIRLNLRGPDAVREAYAAILANARKHAPNGRINGVLVQQMVPAGLEIMVGARIDPQFGPLIVVGLGGVLVELLKDTVVALAPVSHGEALQMLDRLKGRALLDGFRGSAAVDRKVLADAICRLSELAADQAERLGEFDVNPLICTGSQVIAVDALLVKHVATVSGSAAPHAVTA